MARSHKLLVTVEDNAVAGGAGSAVNELVLAAGESVQILNIGLPDRYIEHGSIADCLTDAGLDTHGILEQVNSRLEDMAVDGDAIDNDTTNPLPRLSKTLL